MVFGKFDLGQTSVGNSRYFKRSNIIWRRRKSPTGFTFTTRESVDFSTVLVHKSDLSTEPYMPGKLFEDILRACDHLSNAHNDAWHLMQTVEVKLLGHLTKTMSVDSATIAEVTSETLKAYNAAAFVKYSSMQQEIRNKRDLEHLMN